MTRTCSWHNKLRPHVQLTSWTLAKNWQPNLNDLIPCWNSLQCSACQLCANCEHCFCWGAIVESTDRSSVEAKPTNPKKQGPKHLNLANRQMAESKITLDTFSVPQRQLTSFDTLPRYGQRQVVRLKAASLSKATFSRPHNNGTHQASDATGEMYHATTCRYGVSICFSCTSRLRPQRPKGEAKTKYIKKFLKFLFSDIPPARSVMPTWSSVESQPPPHVQATTTG